jgi:hypothetical protein
MSRQRLTWRARPVAADFAAAGKYLSLLNDVARSRALVAALRRRRVVWHAAKDLLRASALPLLPCDDAQVEADLKRIRKGKALSPVLLIAGEMSRPRALTVADGYHRICAICYYDEDAPVACLLAAAEA